MAKSIIIRDEFDDRAEIVPADAVRIAIATANGIVYYRSTGRRRDGVEIWTPEP